MKKLFTLLTLGLLIVSCQKEYTCSCTTVIGQDSSQSSTTIKGKKEDATKECADKEFYVQGGNSRTCYLK